MTEEDNKTRFEKASEGISIAMRIVLGLALLATVTLISWSILKIFDAVP